MSRCYSLIVLLFCLNACGFVERSRMRIPQEPQRIIYVKGSPSKLIEGTQLRPALAWPRSVSDLPHYAIESIEFAPSAEAILETTSQLEIEDNNKNSDTIAPPTELYRFSRSGDDLWLIRDGESEPELVFQWNALNADWTLTGWRGQTVESLHASTSQDASRMSFLFRLPAGESLHAYFLVGNEVTRDPPNLVDKRYKYIAGEGLPIGYRDNPLNLDICIKPENDSWDDTNLEYYLAADTAWSNWLQNPKSYTDRYLGNTQVITNFHSDYPPFSDVNTHCIYAIDAYDFSSKPSSKVSGITLVILNPFSWEIAHSTVLIPKAFYGDPLMRVSRDYLRQTMEHEIGHMLGLGHQFERNSETGEYLYPSVMSYGDYGLQPYDFEAAGHAYGTRN